jgi:2-polyprenyl-3-methyl-5-hydroxy-6-metoxy-1,4-benzoquinol methylase
VEWQKYGCSRHITMMQTNPAVMCSSELNVTRIQIFSDMISHLGNDLKVLDVGCGEGAIGEPISKMGNYVVSTELPKIATLAHKSGAPSVVANDAEHLTFASNSFDLVIASEVLEHLWNPNNFFDEAYRVLKTSGNLIIETPEGKGSLLYDDHKNYFTIENLKQTLDKKFALCEVERMKATGCAQTPTIILLLHKSTDTM